MAATTSEEERTGGSTRLEDARARMYQELIFESAESLFGEKGFESATMQEIAREAGVSLKTIYAQYPGKRDLYEAIMVTRGREMFEAVQAAHAAEPDPRSRLVAGTRAFAAYLFEHRDWSRIHVRSQVSWAARPAGVVAGALWDEGQKAHVDLLAEGARAGVFYDEDPAEIALMIRALTRVHVVNAIERGEDDLEAITDRLVKRICRMVCVPEESAREVA